MNVNKPTTITTLFVQVDINKPKKKNLVRDIKHPSNDKVNLNDMTIPSFFNISGVPCQCELNFLILLSVVQHHLPVTQKKQL